MSLNSYSKLYSEYIKSSEDWDNTTSVRNSTENYNLSISTNNTNENKLSWSLESFSPVLEHPNFQNLSKKDKKYIVGIQLLDFLLKTKKFEIRFVNDVASNISLNKFEFNFSEKMKLDALKIYTDEAYHAYFSEKVAHQVREFYSIEDDFNGYVNPFFEKVNIFLENKPKEFRHLAKLALVIISENTILSDLSQAMKGIVYDPLRNMFKDHIVDEAFHAKFFSQVLFIVWEQIDLKKKLILGQYLCEAIELLSKPRIDCLYYAFEKIGFDKLTVENAIKETYTKDFNNSRSQKRYKSSFKVLLDNIEAFKLDPLAKRLSNMGF